MTDNSTDIDLLSINNHDTTMKTEADISLGDQTMILPESAPRLEKPFEGTNTLDEPVIVTIVACSLREKRPQYD